MFPDRSPRLKIDPGAVGASLALLPEQIVSAWRQIRRIDFPRAYRRPTAVVIAGMGGSHLGADIARSVFADTLPVPVVVVPDYRLPPWVGRHTLVLATSYSGGPEETLAELKQAHRRHARVLAITSGGRLAQFARRWSVPLVLYEPRENPSRQPRLGLAYSLVATLHAWQRLGLIELNATDRQTMVWTAREAVRRFDPTVPAKRNLAKQLATHVHRHIPFLVGGTWTVGNLQTWTNQIHENAKTFAAFDILPDMHHHLLEGLRDRRFATQFASILIRDPHYPPRIQLRLKATKTLFDRFGARPIVVTPRATTRLNAAIELLALGGYVSWYLSILNHVDPAPIPIVDEVKRWLARQ